MSTLLHKRKIRVWPSLSTKQRWESSRRYHHLTLMKSSDLQFMDSPSCQLMNDDVLPACTELKTKICILFPSSSISEYINYWLFSTSYPISMWNVTSALEYDEPRTKNASEWGKNALNRAFKAVHFSLWTFLTKLRKFHAEVETKYLQLAVGTNLLKAGFHQKDRIYVLVLYSVCVWLM